LSAAPQPPVQESEGVFVVRVCYGAIEAIGLLSRYDLFEYNNTAEKYVLVAVDRAGLQSLRDLGFRAEVDAEETANFARLSVPLAEQTEPGETGAIEIIPGYTCYRTVEETYAAAQALATAHPDLATWTDIGTRGRRAWARRTATT
jgi:hypothetical protein